MRYKVISVLLACASCAHSPNSMDEVAQNMMSLFGPVSESRADWIGVMDIAKCVSLKSRDVINTQSYSEFEIELMAYAEALSEYTTSISTNDNNGIFPVRTKILNEYVEQLIPTIVACEELVGVSIEF